MHNQKMTRGFSLIELMIVVAVIAILAKIAIPSYQDSIQKSRLSVAKGVLLEAAQTLERSYTLNNSYPASIPASLTTAPKAGEGTAYFNIVYTPANSNTTYSLVAKVVTGYAPSTCMTLQLNSTGEKLASDTAVTSIASPGTAAVNTRCWNS